LEKNEKKGKKAGRAAGKGLKDGIEDEVKDTEIKVKAKIEIEKNSIADFQNRIKALEDRKLNLEIGSRGFNETQEEIDKLKAELEALTDPEAEARRAAEAEEKRLEALRKSNEERLAANEEAFRKEIAQINLLEAQKELTEKEANRKRLEAEKKFIEDRLSIVQEGSREYLELSTDLIEITGELAEDQGRKIGEGIEGFFKDLETGLKATGQIVAGVLDIAANDEKSEKRIRDLDRRIERLKEAGAAESALVQLQAERDKLRRLLPQSLLLQIRS